LLKFEAGDNELALPTKDEGDAKENGMLTLLCCCWPVPVELTVDTPAVAEGIDTLPTVLLVAEGIGTLPTVLLVAEGPVIV
jgi:hypothetical protein